MEIRNRRTFGSLTWAEPSNVMLVARMDTSTKSALRASQKTKAAVNAVRKMGISEKTVGITM